MPARRACSSKRIVPTAVYNAATGCISRDDGDGPLAPKNLSVSASSTQEKQPTFGTSGAKLAMRPVMSSSSTFLASRPAASLALRLACICGFALLALPGSALADAETDRKIERAAQSSYNFRAILNNQVQVAANDGIVTLTGVVRDQQQKSLAEVTVRELPGVISVENKLETSSPMHERADDRSGGSTSPPVSRVSGGGGERDRKHSHGDGARSSKRDNTHTDTKPNRPRQH